MDIKLRVVKNVVIQIVKSSKKAKKSDVHLYIGAVGHRKGRG